MRWILVLLLLAGPLFAGDEALSAARAAMEAQLKAGDELRAKGDLEGAIAAYKKAVATFKEVVAREQAEETGKPAPPAAAPEVPADDGTAEGRQRVVAYYVKILAAEDSSDEARYKAVAQLGELRAVEARDALLRTLEKDKYQVARRAAAWSLGRLGKDGVAAIPALIREIGGDSPLLGHMCERALGDITEAALGERVSMGYDDRMTAEQRLAVQKKWQEWWEKNHERIAAPAEKKEE